MEAGSLSKMSARNDHCVEVMSKLNDQRQRGKFCDVSLLVQGREFKAHKNVLSAASPYFDMMFTCDMKEKEQEAVHLEELSVNAMVCVLDYIYTGDVQVNEENAQDLVASADYLLFRSLKARSIEFLQQNLDISNCISTYYLAAKFECHDLLRSANEFIKRNFNSVSESENFLALSYDQVRKWISSDDIIVRAEEDVFEVVLRWIGKDKSGERENHFLELFQDVRLTSLPRHYFFTDVIKNRLVRGNPQCLDLALVAMKQIDHPSGEYVPRQNPRKCLEKHVDAVVLCGGLSTICYLPSKRCWNKLADMKAHRKFHGGSSCQGLMYVVGGNVYDSASAAERYDPLMDSWSVVASPPVNLRHAAIVGLQGFLYLIGGRVQQLPVKRVDNVCRYDPDSNSWQYVASLSSPRSHICAVADDNYIYAIGGRVHNDNYALSVNMVERFHPRANAWTSLPSMTETRAMACGVVLGENIFVLGGTADGLSAAHSCEKYSCVTNQWQVISSMQFPRYHAGAVAFGGAIYVFGGLKDRNTSELSVELYNPLNDKWEREGTMPSVNHLGASFKACALRLCKTVLQPL